MIISIEKIMPVTKMCKNDFIFLLIDGTISDTRLIGNKFLIQMFLYEKDFCLTASFLFYVY